MVHQSEDQLFKYATKEDGFGLLKLLKESNANIKEIENHATCISKNNDKELKKPLEYLALNILK